MDTETIKPIVFLLAIVAGQIMLVYIPYYLKQQEDGREFDLNYAYTAIIGYVVMAVLALSSEAVMNLPLDFMSIIWLMFGGAVTQGAIVGRVTPKKIVVVDV